MESIITQHHYFIWHWKLPNFPFFHTKPSHFYLTWLLSNEQNFWHLTHSSKIEEKDKFFDSDWQCLNCGEFAKNLDLFGSSVPKVGQEIKAVIRWFDLTPNTQTMNDIRCGVEFDFMSNCKTIKKFLDGENCSCIKRFVNIELVHWLWQWTILMLAVRRLPVSGGIFFFKPRAKQHP